MLRSRVEKRAQYENTVDFEHSKSTVHCLKDHRLFMVIILLISGAGVYKAVADQFGRIVFHKSYAGAVGLFTF